MAADTLAGPARDPHTSANSAVGVEPLGRRLDDRLLPSARRRLTPEVLRSDPRWGWLGPLLVTALAGLLRLWNLGFPHLMLFDETYYAKDAYSMLRFGYVQGFVDKANDQILAGHLGHLFTGDAAKIVHPEVGKWMIAAGEAVFGMNPVGWRVAAAVTGALTVLVLARLVRRLTGSTLLGCVAGLLLCFDGLHFVLSRMALLDGFLAFWLVCALACLVADRDWGRLLLARAAPPAPGARLGPVRALLLRPWRIGAAVCFGLACGTKWNGLYVFAAFFVLMLAWDVGARRTYGVRRPVLAALVADALPAVLTVLGVALLTYVASWTGWLIHADAYEKTFGADWGSYLHPDARGFFPEAVQSLRSLWHYHVEVYDFHTGVPDANGWSILNATHPYSSHPGSWPVLGRPVGVDAQLDIKPGEQQCTASDSCLRQILLIGTPVLWWGGVLALLASLVAWIGQRDWRFGVAVVGFLAAWLPWFRYTDRPIFLYYAVAMIPFTVIALTLWIGVLLGPPTTSARRRWWGSAVGGAFVLLVVVNFAYFYPIYTDQLVTHTQWLHRIWFRSWI